MKKYIHVAALLIASTTFLLAASPALSANVDVGINIGVPVYVEPRPIYVQPRPVYVQPQPVYIQPQRVIVETQPVYVEQDEDDRYWDCKNDKCKHKKYKKEKHHKHDDRDDD